MHLQEYIDKYKRLHEGKDGCYLIDPKDSSRKKYEPADRKNLRMNGSQTDGYILQLLRKWCDRRGESITVLDYGCGKGFQLGRRDWINETVYEQLEHRIQAWWLYDPAVKAYSKLPPEGLKFDAIMCVDVMEHIPEEYIDEVLAIQSSYLKEDGEIFFSIGQEKAWAHFEDGENFHCTLKDIRWWYDRLDKHFNNFTMLASKFRQKGQYRYRKMVKRV